MALEFFSLKRTLSGLLKDGNLQNKEEGKNRVKKIPAFQNFTFGENGKKVVFFCTYHFIY